MSSNTKNATAFCYISDVVLAKSSLFRFEEGRDVEARLQKVLTYQYEKSEYYGQVRKTEKLTRFLLIFFCGKAPTLFSRNKVKSQST